MAERQGTFRKSNMSLEDNYKWLNENWDKEMKRIIPEKLRKKAEDTGITVGFTGIQKEDK